MINIGPICEPISGTVAFVRDGFHFVFENRQGGLDAGTMLKFSTLVVEIDGDDGKLQYPEGFLSMYEWVPRSFTKPDLIDRRLYSDIIPMTGAAYPAENFSAGHGDFFPEYDADKNLLRLTREGVKPSQTAIQFCEGAALGFQEKAVADLWIIDPLFRDTW
ncbi:hypothetical protein C5C45_15865 [Rathayibacter rathayi]|nr:hypothetical protein [Rathayibacter rathayi]AZZ48678.1 hypothetical protein C1O28_05295 [Rathayibacter rathayi]MWV76068.1 hypothetical protein [Rathayibacter rathayi NCPPB 2980 = VKM Ac-1601]PPF41692.1 hypothetical protein C5C08_15890 [Rathayibacter rathayi]PPF73315.1 hypothetical protein C5C14_15760 [Rathayibacter rathayi]PPG07492.1 hypothetical protein C5C11_16080 [Rathayibacter rathayi]